jgi:glycosyltransferase involved in cell wall biosynthesis
MGDSVLSLALWRLHRLQQQERYDLIHADLPVAGILARIVGRYHRVPVVYTEHNVQERYHPVTRWGNRVTFGWNTRVLAVSQDVADSIRRADMPCKAPVKTLLNGIPVEQVRAEATGLDQLRQELSIPKSHLVVGAVAVFRRQKRLEDWLQVAAQVAAEQADVTFLLVGDGPEMAHVRANVQAVGLADRVRLPGFRADGRRLMGLMDIYLMMSEFEGLPIALLEAMALGKPVVSTAVGGIPELVQSGREGLLVPVGDTAAAAGHVVQLLSLPAYRQAMGRAGAEKVERQFHLKSRVQTIEALYTEILRTEELQDRPPRPKPIVRDL